MATSTVSSALRTNLLSNSRFAHFLLRNSIQRNIQQRRKTRGLCLINQQDYTSLSCRLMREERSWCGLDGGYQCTYSSGPRVDLFARSVSVSHQYEGWWRIRRSDEKGALESKRSCTPPHHTVRPLSTTSVILKSVDTSEQSRSVASWEVMKKKENRIREAGKDLLDDFKETKAKVRERMDEIIERENIWTIPNLLCISRICLSPALSYMVITSHYHAALGLFMLAGFTDLLDGWIARTFPSQASNLGSFLDPLADKVLVAVLVLSLTYVGLIPLPLTGLIIYRDVLIIGGASFVRYKSLPPPRTLVRYFDATHATARLAPTTLSKVNTAVQLGLITAALAAPVFAYTDHYMLKAMWWLTAASTLSSGLSYIFSRDTYKFLRSMKEEE